MYITHNGQKSEKDTISIFHLLAHCNKEKCGAKISMYR